MAGYAESLLTRGEVVVIRGRQHWLATIVDGRRAWGLFVVAVALLVIGTQVPANLQVWSGYLGAVLLLASGIWLAVRYWDWLNQEYLVTNRRVVKVEGIINKRAADSSLEKINDAVLDQNLVGRLLGYADLDILTAADQAIDRFRMLDRALAFKRAMLEQRHELELELGRESSSRPAIGSPAAATGPAIATATAGSPATSGIAGLAPGAATAALAGGPSALVGAGIGSPPPAQPAMSAADIIAAIDDLADLRDRGAIAAAEFETKKAELLRRL